MRKYAKYLLLPIIGPLALAWMIAGVFLILLPCEIFAFGFDALGEPEKCDAILNFAMEVMYLERWPWKR